MRNKLATDLLPNKKSSILALIILLLPVVLNAQKYSRQEYIDAYRETVITEMIRTGIPASIKMAQAMLESGNGNSTLARKGNNHFGIKCHTWKGKKIYHDDDAKNECFRKYNSADESFKDHSEFLVTAPRYRSLFDLKETDYKGWAKGLKKAGYATARTYDKRLIEIIESNKLYMLDEEAIARRDGKAKPGKDVLYAKIQSPTHGFVDGHKTIKTYNGINYVVAAQGETVEDLTQKLELLKWEIPKYNEFEHRESNSLEPNEKIYIQPKRRKAPRGTEHHQVKNGQSMYDISQQYGIKLKRLYKLNRMEEGAAPIAGETLNLRSKRDRDNEVSTKTTQKKEQPVQNTTPDSTTPQEPTSPAEGTTEDAEFEVIFDPDL